MLKTVWGTRSKKPLRFKCESQPGRSRVFQPPNYAARQAKRVQLSRSADCGSPPKTSWRLMGVRYCQMLSRGICSMEASAYVMQPKVIDPLAGNGHAMALNRGGAVEATYLRNRKKPPSCTRRRRQRVHSLHTYLDTLGVTRRVNERLDMKLGSPE
jgi:hypothetical protein